MKIRWKQILIWLGISLLTLGILLFPSQVAEAARGGLEQCGTVLIPALFPFLTLSGLVVHLGGGEALSRRLGPVMTPLFGVGGAGAAALLLGLIGGYPVGAQTVRGLCDRGQCSRQEGERLLCFCNNCGPAFLLGVAGSAVLGSAAAGWLLWLGHVLAALLMGILLRLTGGVCASAPRPAAPAGASRPGTASFPTALVESVTGAARSVLQLCAFVIFFAVLIRLLAVTRVLALSSRGLAVLLAPLGVNLTGCTALLTGGLELTRGVLSLSGQSATPAVLALLAFLLGWGGLSVHCQTLAVLHGSGLSSGGYLRGMLLHGLLAAGITFGLALLLPVKEELVLVSYLEPAVSVSAAGLCAGIPGWLGVALVCLTRSRTEAAPVHKK
ncbi:MAG: sporulation protein [Oscillospiraceae bacterium]|nr:sporulation protein [Oscillospiraceae bacterium]